jgi:malate dehydrogenase (oxaloacetate-decarboxylating)(NADP+)
MIAEAVSISTGCTLAEGAKNVWFVDSKGLITNARGDKLAHHKLPFAHDPPAGLENKSYPDGAEGEALRLLDAIKAVKPSAIIGVSAQGGSFTKAVCEEMAKLNKAPLIFALSNPTSKAECTATQAYEWTEGIYIYVHIYLCMGTCIYHNLHVYTPLSLTL